MDMHLFFHDTETTGLPVWKEPSGSENQPHLVQLAGLLVNAETRKEVASLDLIIKPDGWTIPEELTKIHGISQEYANDVGVPEADAVSLFLSMWGGGNKRVAHNRTFDQRIIRIACKRYFDDGTTDAWAAKEDFDCTMLMSKPIIKIPPTVKMVKAGFKQFKQPSLAEAYKHFMGRELEDAHSALADARGCKDIFFAMRDLQAKAA
ncbi:MAG: 3'-5' exonuclease [Sneathiella sp.]